MAKKFYFSFPYASYMDISLMRETHTKKQLLAEYKAMREEANRRLDRLSKYKWMKDSDAYQYNKDLFKGAVSRMTKADLAKKMREAAIFLSSKSSTVAGQRRRRDELMDTFREDWGLTFLNKRNTVDFARFLGAARAYYGAAHYNMNEIEAMFLTAKTDRKDENGKRIPFDVDEIEKDFAAFENDIKKNDAYAKHLRAAKERYSSENYDRGEI